MGLHSEELGRIRASLVAASPHLTPPQVEVAVEAVVRQHGNAEEHDRSLIAERLAWRPEERLRAMQEWLGFIEDTKAANRR